MCELTLNRWHNPPPALVGGTYVIAQTLVSVGQAASAFERCAERAAEEGATPPLAPLPALAMRELPTAPIHDAAVSYRARAFGGDR